MTDNLLDPQNNQAPSISSYRELLVGEGKKFADDESVAKGKYESDNYIKILEQRLDERESDNKKLREANTSQANMQELIDQYKQLLATKSENTQQASGVTEKPFDPKELKSMITSELQQHEAVRREQDNFNTVRNKLKEEFGDNYPTILKQKMETLGLSDSRLNELARSEPTFLLKSLGVGEQGQRESFQAPPRSDLRSDNFKPRGAEKRTWSYYQKMRKENPSLYERKSTAVQMHNDAIALGDEFNDGDFGRSDRELLRQLNN